MTYTDVHTWINLPLESESYKYRTIVHLGKALKGR